MYSPIITEATDYITQQAVKESSTRIVPKETVLTVVRSGVLAHTFSVCLVGIDLAFNQDIKAIQPNVKLLNVNFLVLSLKWLQPKILHKGIKKGATVHSMRSGFLESLLVPLPPIAEQKRVVAILSDRLATVEQARQATQAQLKAAQALPAAYLRQIFNSPETQTWEKRPLREICLGNGQYGTSQVASIEDKGLPVLRMGNIIDGQIDWSDLKFIDLPEPEANKYWLEKGDIIFNRTNSDELVGKTAVFDGHRKAIFASYLIRFQLIENLADSDFVTSYINSSLGREFIEAHMSRAIGQVNISASTMHKMFIPLPPIQEQKKAAKFLKEKAEQKIQLCQSLQDQLNTINALPATLLRQAFNGEL